MDELTRASETAVRLIQEAVKKFSRTVEKTESLKEENLRLACDISAGEAKVKELQKQLDDARTDLAAAKGTVHHLEKQLAATEAREVDLASTQSGVLPALAERIFHNKKFSLLVSG